MDRRLLRMHLGPDRRMDPVGPHQQPPVRLRARAIGVLDQGRHPAAGVLAISGDPAAQPHGIRAGPLQQRVVQQHVELAAVDRILRPPVAGQPAAGFAIDVRAIEPDQGPLLGRHADGLELSLADAEVVEFAHGVGLQVDADAERPHLPHRLIDDAGHADLMQGQRRRQAADAASGDNHEIIRHRTGLAPRRARAPRTGIAVAIVGTK